MTSDLMRNNLVKINCDYLGFGSIHFATVQKVISIIYILEAMLELYQNECGLGGARGCPLLAGKPPCNLTN